MPDECIIELKPVTIITGHKAKFGSVIGYSEITVSPIIVIAIKMSGITQLIVHDIAVDKDNAIYKINLCLIDN